MRRLVSILALGVAVLAAVGVALFVALQPPRLAVPARLDHVFRDVVLLEPGQPPRPATTLRVAEGLIRSISRSGGALEGNVGAEASDLAGLFVVPGLVDMHVHYPPAVAVGNAELWSLLFLSHGVTSIRETGSIDGSVFDVRETIRSGGFPGPRIFACGAMLDGPRPSFPSNRVVETPAEARTAVADQAARGADCIKVYNMLAPKVLAAIRAAAAEAGLPVIGHAPHSVPLEEVGIRDLQHGTGVVLVDRDRIGRLDFRTEDWATVDDDRIAYAARVSRAQGIEHTPTLVNARMRRLLVDADAAVARDTGLRHLPRFWSRVWALLWGPPFAAGDAEGEATYDRFRARHAAMTAGLHAAGVRVHAGTDTLMPFVAPGSSLHGELADLVGAGIAPEAAWAMASRGPGESLGVPGLGTLAVGAPADLLFLRDDPRGDLSALGRIEAVLADGRLYRRAELDVALARFDAHFHGRLYATVMGTAARLLGGLFEPD